MSTNNPMTQERLDAIASRATAAERGPWEMMNGGDNETSTFIDGPEGDVLIRDWRGSAYLREEYVWIEEPNAEFIAHAREDIPALLAEVERLRDELAKTRAVTDAAVERMARAIADLEPGEPWPTNAELGGGPTGTRDDEFWHDCMDHARAVLAALLGGGQA